jgi:hypothetical protein
MVRMCREMIHAKEISSTQALWYKSHKPEYMLFRPRGSARAQTHQRARDQGPEYVSCNTAPLLLSQCMAPFLERRKRANPCQTGSPGSLPCHMLACLAATSSHANRSLSIQYLCLQKPSGEPLLKRMKVLSWVWFLFFFTRSDVVRS